MKPTSGFKTGMVMMTIALVSVSHGLAASAPAPLSAAAVRQQLKNLPNPELPAQTANLVLTARGDTREEQAAMIVTVSTELNPAAAPLIVGSVCRISPDVAATVASAAAKIEPQQMEAIANAATLAAPGQALKILASLCKDHGKQYRTIATSIAKALPGTDRSVLSAMSEAMPSLKLFIARSVESLTKDKDFSVTVPTVLNQVAADLANTSRVLKTSSDDLVEKGVAPSQFALMPPPPLPSTVQPRKLVAFQPFDARRYKDPKLLGDTIPVTGGRNYSKPAN